MKKWWLWLLIIIVILLILAALYWFFFKDKNEPSPTVTSTPVSTQSASPSATTTNEDESQTTTETVKTPHFVSSDPEAGAVLTATVSKVTITFNFDLAAGSKITVMADGNLVNTPDATKISADKLSMSQTINPVEPADYKVTYVACWPDGSCHNGSFGYIVE